MAQYAIQTPAHAGATVTLAAPGGTTGDTVVPTPGGALLFVNGATVATLTITFPVGLAKTDGQTVAARTVTITASVPTIVPIPISVYGTAALALSYSNITTLTGGATGVAYIFIPTS